MNVQNLTDELSDLRIQIARLQRRAAYLETMRLAAVAADAPQTRRPGWPIRRVPGEVPAMH